MLIDKINAQIVVPLIYLLIAVAVVVFLWGLAEFIVKADDPAGRETGKKHLLWGLVGMIIIGSVYGIISIIQNTLISFFK